MSIEAPHTHFVRWDQPVGPRHGSTTALCGRPTSIDRHATQPDCPDCVARLAEDDGKTAEELFGTPGECGPPPPVRKEFNVFAGYRPRGERRRR